MPYGPVTAFDESISNRTATNSVELGTRRWEGKNEYVYVFNASGNTTISPGYGVFLTAVTGYSVNVTSVTSITPCFGIVQDATFGSADYGWVVVKGFVNIEVSTTTSLGTSNRSNIYAVACNSRFSLSNYTLVLYKRELP